MGCIFSYTMVLHAMLWLVTLVSSCKLFVLYYIMVIIIRWGERVHILQLESNSAVKAIRVLYLLSNSRKPEVWITMGKSMQPRGTVELIR